MTRLAQAKINVTAVDAVCASGGAFGAILWVGRATSRRPPRRWGRVSPTSAPRLALHTWTLDTTPLPEAVAAAKAAGWDAVELRRLDWNRAREAGRAATWSRTRAGDRASRRVRGRGVRLDVGRRGRAHAPCSACSTSSCARAKALGGQTVMSPVDKGAR